MLFLSDPHPTIRLRALKALIDRRALDPTLAIRLLADEDSRVRTLPVRALREDMAGALPALKRVASHCGAPAAGFAPRMRLCWHACVLIGAAGAKDPRVLTVSRTLPGPPRPYLVLAQLHARPGRFSGPASIAPPLRPGEHVPRCRAQGGEIRCVKLAPRCRGSRPARRSSPGRIDSVTANSRGAGCIRHEWLPFDELIRIFLKLEMAFLLSTTAGIRLMMPT